LNDIIFKTNERHKSETHSFNRIKEIDKKMNKYRKGIEKFLQMQEGVQILANRKKSVLDWVYDNEYDKVNDLENFKSKEVIEKVRTENF
jgi:hypothetical protein